MAKDLEILWLKKAFETLRAAVDHIALDHPQAAKNFMSQVEHQIALLRRHPHMGRVGKTTGTRELIIQRYHYIIPYRIKHDCIEIIRVFHMARQYPPQNKN